MIKIFIKYKKLMEIQRLITTWYIPFLKKTVPAVKLLVKLLVQNAMLRMFVTTLVLVPVRITAELVIVNISI